MSRIQNRRRFLATLCATAGAGALAGCGERTLDPQFRLTAYEIDDVAAGHQDGGYLVDSADIDSKYTVGYSDSYRRSRVEELIETGSMTARGWPLASRTEWGPVWRDGRRCIEHDGTYYRLRTEAVTESERTRWQLRLRWIGLRTEPEVAIDELSAESLSEQDQELLTSTAASLPDPELDFRTEPIVTATYHDELDPEASELIPSPPFTHLKHDDGAIQVTAEQASVTRTERTISAEPVAESRSAYEQYARENFPDARYSSIALSDDAEEVLDQVTSSEEEYTYSEEPSLSTELESVLEPLGIARHLEPHDAYSEVVWFRDALAEYRDSWYVFTLMVHPGEEGLEGDEGSSDREAES